MLNFIWIHTQTLLINSKSTKQASIMGMIRRYFAVILSW
jgi:hypothetical protein